MEIDIFTLCDFAEEVGGKLFITGTFDTIFAPQLPAQQPTCHLAIRTRFEPHEIGRHTFTISIKRPNGTVLVPDINGEFILQIPPGAPSGANHLVIGYGGLRFDTYGTYTASLSIDGEEVKSVILAVREAPPQVRR